MFLRSQATPQVKKEELKEDNLELLEKYDRTFDEISMSLAWGACAKMCLDTVRRVSIYKIKQKPYYFAKVIIRKDSFKTKNQELIEHLIKEFIFHMENLVFPITWDCEYRLAHFSTEEKENEISINFIIYIYYRA